jgi:hypothetical protein
MFTAYGAKVIWNAEATAIVRYSGLVAAFARQPAIGECGKKR